MACREVRYGRVRPRVGRAIDGRIDVRIGLVPWIRKRRRELLILITCAGAIGVIYLLLGPIAMWATPVTALQGKDRADAINVTRQILLAAAGGLALLTGAAFTARTYFLSRRGQLTDRYVKAIGLLASEKITERIGGIYALEHLMIESERDHHTVVEVLAAFIRERPRGLPVTRGTPNTIMETQTSDRGLLPTSKPR